jgi:hypothetical protein
MLTNQVKAAAATATSDKWTRASSLHSRGRHAPAAAALATSSRESTGWRPQVGSACAASACDQSAARERACSELRPWPDRLPVPVRVPIRARLSRGARWAAVALPRLAGAAHLADAARPRPRTPVSPGIRRREAEVLRVDCCAVPRRHNAVAALVQPGTLAIGGPCPGGLLAVAIPRLPGFGVPPCFPVRLWSACGGCSRYR